MKLACEAAAAKQRLVEKNHAYRGITASGACPIVK
jgi:hypothetical protein